MLSRRFRTITLAILAALALAVTLWLLLSRRPAEAPTPAPQPQPTTTGSTLPTGGETPEPPTPQPTQTEVIVVARSFAERFSSWSNDDGFASFELLEGEAAEPVRAFLRSYRADLEARYPVSGGYHGVTGRALSPRLDALDEEAGVAEATIGLQLAESSGAAVTPAITNRQLSLRLVRRDGQWLVDFLKWVSP